MHKGSMLRPSVGKYIFQSNNDAKETSTDDHRCGSSFTIVSTFSFSKNFVVDFELIFTHRKGDSCVFSVATFFSLLFSTYFFLITFDTALTGLEVSSILEQFHASVSFLSPPNVFRYIRGGAGGAGRGVDQ